MAFLVAERMVAAPRGRLSALLDEDPALRGLGASLITPPESDGIRDELYRRTGRADESPLGGSRARGLTLTAAVAGAAQHLSRLPVDEDDEWYCLCGKEPGVGIVRMPSCPGPDPIRALCAFDREIVFLGSARGEIAVIDMMWDTWGPRSVECDLVLGDG